MTTKVLNKLVNICTTLSDGDSGTSNALTSYEIIDLIYPVGSIYTLASGALPSQLFGGGWTMLDSTAVESSLISSTTTVYRWQRIQTTCSFCLFLSKAS